MARRLTPAEIREAFRVFGVPHVEVAGWETRSNRSGWGDPRVTGVMYHHTGDDASDLRSRAVVRDGHSTLAGPLCNFGVTDTGKIEIIAAGAANHAGNGDPQTLALVQKEQTPLDREVKPDQSGSSAGSVAGNPRFYGWESYYGGGSDLQPNALQHRVTLLSQAAIIWALDRIDGGTVKWTGRAMIGHREWTTNKVDPRDVKLHVARQDISWLLTTDATHRAHWLKTGSRTLPTTPTEPPVTEPTMQDPKYAGTPEQQANTKAFLGSDVIKAPNPTPTNTYWGVGSTLEWTLRRTVQTHDFVTGPLDTKIDDLTTQVARLTALVQHLVDTHAPLPADPTTPEVPQ